MSDQFARYLKALATGNRIEWERGDVASGFYKLNTGRGASKPIEAIAIYRDDTGTLQCIRDVYGDGSRMDADQIEELFASCCLYPIAEDVYRAVEDGRPWPPEYATRLTMKDQAAGVAWTPEYGRKKLGSATKAAEPAQDAPENPRAVIGDNRPPEPTSTDSEPQGGHRLDGDQTPDKVAYAEISALGAEVKVWLDSIGGKPRDKAEADTMADYATKFKSLWNKAEKERVAEKEPHLSAGRDVDARWKQPIANAEMSRKRCLEIAQQWREAEDARRQAEAEKASATASAPIQAEKVGGLGNIRTVGEREQAVWQLDDAREYLRHLLSLNSDLPAEIVEAAAKVVRSRAVEAPGVSKLSRKVAA